MTINFKKLAAIDIALLGAKFIITEFAFGTIFSIALGLFVVLRSHSHPGIWFGVYLICLGINYAPMLAYAVSIGNREAAKTQLGSELLEKRAAMAKYRRMSLFLLVPLFVPLFEMLGQD